MNRISILMASTPNQFRISGSPREMLALAPNLNRPWFVGCDSGKYRGWLTQVHELVRTVDLFLYSFQKGSVICAVSTVNDAGPALFSACQFHPLLWGHLTTAAGAVLPGHNRKQSNGRLSYWFLFTLYQCERSSYLAGSIPSTPVYLSRPAKVDGPIQVAHRHCECRDVETNLPH